MKKLISILLVLCIFTGCIIFPSMASASFLNDSEFDDLIEYYAYKDYETASREMKAVILEARNIIIFSYSWVADGYEGGITCSEGFYEELPSFSDLFPEWELPYIIQPLNTIIISELFIDHYDDDDYSLHTAPQNPTYFLNSVPFLKPPANSLFGARMFGFLSRQHNFIKAGSVSGSVPLYNLGLQASGKPLTWGVDMGFGHLLTIKISSGIWVEVFTSTNYAPGVNTVYIFGVD